MTKKQCPLGEACDLTTAWMAGAEKAKDQIDAQAAEIERLRGDLAKALESLQGLLWAWNELCRAVPVLFHDPNADAARATIATLTGSATVKDYLTTENEKQSHEWKCPIDYPGCRKNCGSQYGCKN